MSIFQVVSLIVAFSFVKVFGDCSVVSGSFIYADDAGEDGLCTISTGSYTVTTNWQLPGTKDINIVGSPTTLIGGCIVFTVTTGNILAVKNLAFKYLSGYEGHLISVTNGGLALEDVSFGEESQTNTKLAVIYLYEFTFLNVTNSNFTNINNTEVDMHEAGDVTKPVLESFGGCIHGETSQTSVTLEFVDSNFTRTGIKASRGYGGAFVITTTGRKNVYNILRCIFTGCTSGYYNGAFDQFAYYFYPVVTIDDCIFVDCYAGRDGGAIYVVGEPGIVQNSIFERCSALNDGGAIYFYDDFVANTYKVLSCTFLACVSIGEANRPANGGAIYVEATGHIIIDRSNFTNCKANAFHGQGGAIANFEVVDFISFSITNCNFTGCTVDEVLIGGTRPSDDDGDGGAVSIKVTMYNTIIVANCSFMNCQSTNHGGSLDVVMGSLSVSNCSFVNSLARGGNGGSIHTTGLIVTIENTTFTNSVLGNPSAKGVEVYSTRDILHYGGGNVFACSGKNDVVYGDVSLNLVVCENKTIKDLEYTPETKGDSKALIAVAIVVPVVVTVVAVVIVVLVIVKYQSYKKYYDEGHKQQQQQSSPQGQGQEMQTAGNQQPSVQGETAASV